MFLISGYGASSQILTETIELRPGWNSVWLELDPPDRSPAAVFAGLPILGVWTWSERVSATDFIQNPNGAGWNHAAWLTYFPPETIESRLSNLYAILPRRAYLIHIGGSNAVSWSVTGKPSLQNPEWSPDHFNLRGFPVDPARPPTFQFFFRPSPAHFDSATGRLQPIYRLAGNGQWQSVSPGDLMRRGEAYWVYSRGPSTYEAPFSLSSSTGAEVDYDSVLGRARIIVHNASASSENIRFSPTGGQLLPLFLQDSLATPTNHFTPFADSLLTVSASQSAQLTVALDRAHFTGGTNSGGSYGAVYAASDGLGTLKYFAVEAKAAPALLSGDPGPYAGLWVGTVTITNVAQAHSENPTAPGTVPAGFPMRLLIHVDTNGSAALLREVTLLFSRSNAPAGTNGNYLSSFGPSALITDPAVLKRQINSGLSSGQLKGRRLSTSHFDFPTSPGHFELPLEGVFAVSNQLSGKIIVSSALPTNPFLHRYHPDHRTNLAFQVEREFTLEFLPPSDLPPGFTGTALGGTFSETITGLHKIPLKTSGELVLQRVSTVGILNQPLQ